MFGLTLDEFISAVYSRLSGLRCIERVLIIA